MNKPVELLPAARRIATAGVYPPMGGITLAGQLTASAGTGHNPMRILGSYAVVYLLAGGGSFSDALGRRQSVGAGDLLLIFPEVPHEYGPPPGGQWDEIYFVFNGRIFDEWRTAGLIDPREPVWHAAPVATWHRRFAAVCSGQQEGTPAALVELARLQGVLADFRTAWRSPGPLHQPVVPDWLEPVCAQLEDADKVPDWPRLAAAAGLSYERFRKRFAELKGVPPARYRLLRLVDQACLLLTKDERPLRAIAAQLGFCDEFHFSKVFKQRTGLSPSAYRQQMRR